MPLGFSEQSVKFDKSIFLEQHDPEKISVPDMFLFDGFGVIRNAISLWFRLLQATTSSTPCSKDEQL
jgi:hypothetical protein